MRVAVFIDGTFIPERDGASTRFAYLPSELHNLGVDVVVFHCYRGWSDLDRISREPFLTYFFHPETYYSNQALLTAIATSASIDIIQMNDAETIQRIGYSLASATGARIVYEAHYHASTLASQLSVPPNRVVALQELERNAAMNVDHLIVFTEEDRRRWISLSAWPPDRASIVPFGAKSAFNTADYPGDRRSLAFIGNLYFEPNQRALIRLGAEILPRIRVDRPSTELLVIGDIPTSLRHFCDGAGMTAIGEVLDPDPLLAKAAVGLAPVSESTGVRAKILRYLSAGMPVVATEAAVEGLKGPAVFVENTSASFAARCLDILDRPADYSRQVAEALRTIHETCLWPTVACAARDVYNTVTSRPRRIGAHPSPVVDPCPLPIWLEEVQRSGRFPQVETTAFRGYSAGIAGHGRITFIP